MRRLIVLVLAVIALPVAGCGDDGDSSSDEYAKGFKPVNQRILDLGQKVGGSIQSARTKSDKRIAREFGSHARQLGEIRRDLQALEPPSDLKATHDQLVQALGETRGTLEDIENAAKKSDADAASTATRRLTETSKDLRRARLKLARETGAKLEAGD